MWTAMTEQVEDGRDGEGAPGYVELHAASACSLLRAGSPVEALVALSLIHI